MRQETVYLGFVNQIRQRFCLLLLSLAIVADLVVFAMSVLSPGSVNSTEVMVWMGLLPIEAIMIFLLLQKRFVPQIANALAVGIVVMASIMRQDLLLVVSGFMAVSVAALLGTRPVYVLSVAIFGARMVLLTQSGDPNFATETPLIATVVFLVMVVMGGLIQYASFAFQSVAVAAHQGTRLLEATADVGRITSQLLDRDELFRRAVDLIRDRFGYYHAQIFLVDDAREYAVLVASTGQVGRMLLDRGHKLAVGSQSVIGRVTQLGEVVVTRDTDRDVVHRRNELLPNTRSEVALPIADGSEIIGALDVQSVESHAFTPTDIRALEVMASQLAVTIRNARMFEGQESSLQENKRLFLESEANLREIQRLNRQLTRKAWEDYIAARRHIVGITVAQDGQTLEANWTSAMVEAGRRQRVITGLEMPDADALGSTGKKQTIAAPIMLRGEVLGVIEVEPSDNVRIDDMTEMIRAVAGHLAVSLDNARLFEEAQEGTLQEQRINEIVGRYQSATSVDELLQITLEELGDSLGAKQGMIRLGRLREGTAEAPNTPHNGGRPA